MVHDDCPFDNPTPEDCANCPIEKEIMAEIDNGIQFLKDMEEWVKDHGEVAFITDADQTAQANTVVYESLKSVNPFVSFTTEQTIRALSLAFLVGVYATANRDNIKFTYKTKERMDNKDKSPKCEQLKEHVELPDDIDQFLKDVQEDA